MASTAFTVAQRPSLPGSKWLGRICLFGSSQATETDSVLAATIWSIWCAVTLISTCCSSTIRFMAW